MQKEIDYSEIIELGFKEEFANDNIFFNQYGYKYSIITLEIEGGYYFDWDKTTRKAKLVSIDDEHNILSEMPIKDLKHLKELLYFFLPHLKSSEEDYMFMGC